jgi:hypothetical protein
VPWLCFYACQSGDAYHQTSDGVEKVSSDLIAKISRLAYATAYTLADK